MEYSRIFQRDFKNMMSIRRSRNCGFNLSSLELPEFPDLISIDAYAAGGRMAKVKGISEPYFSQLNNKTVEVVKGRTFESRISVQGLDGSTEFRRTKGSMDYESVSVPAHSVAIYSDVNIHLPNTEEKHGKSVLYKPPDGFGYIDYIPAKGNRGARYLYYVPMEAIYPMELAALVVALSKHRAYFSGYQVALTNGYYVYLYSVPFKYRQNPGYLCVGLKADPDFKDEMHQLISFWSSKQYIFPPKYTYCESAAGEKMNVGVISLPGTCDAESFVPLGPALRSEAGIDSSMYDSALYEQDTGSSEEAEDIPLF